jgi:adenylate cyclase class IV
MRTQVQRWKQELDINITGQSQNVKRLLQQLDFIEYVTVKKHRMAFRVDESSSVALDLVEPLGWFIEIETFGEVADVGIQKNNEIARLLHIEHCQRINVPYRDIVKAGRVDFVAR